MASMQSMSRLSLILLLAFGVSFGVSFGAHAQSGKMHMFMVVKGQVLVGTEQAKVGRKVSEGDQITTKADGRAKIQMADGNVLNISPDTQIVISSYSDKNVELKVDFGKVRAGVVEGRYNGTDKTFNIKTPTAVAGVRGTDFITGYNSRTKSSQVITFSGQVAVGTPGPGGKIQNPVFVQAGQSTSVSSSGVAEAPKALPPQELKKMDSESNSEAPPSSGGGQASNDKGGEKKKETAKEDSPAGREPASTSPQSDSVAAANPTMIKSTDVGPNLNIIPVMPILPVSRNFEPPSIIPPRTNTFTPALNTRTRATIIIQTN